MEPLCWLFSSSVQRIKKYRCTDELTASTGVVAALLGKRMAFRSHRTFLGDHMMEIVFYDKLCPSCGAPSRLYSIASSWEDVLRADCGSRVLLWSEALYHPDVAHAARRAYETTPRLDETTLVVVEPRVGFRCHRCRRRLAPSRAGHPGLGIVAVAACVTFTRLDLITRRLSVVGRACTWPCRKPH